MELTDKHYRRHSRARDSDARLYQLKERNHRYLHPPSPTYLWAVPDVLEWPSDSHCPLCCVAPPSGHQRLEEKDTWPTWANPFPTQKCDLRVRAGSGKLSQAKSSAVLLGWGQYYLGSGEKCKFLLGSGPNKCTRWFWCWQKLENLCPRGEEAQEFLLLNPSLKRLPWGIWIYFQ